MLEVSNLAVHLQTQRGPADAMPLSHWNPASFGKPLFNQQEGKMLKVRCTQVGPGHWSVRGDAEIDFSERVISAGCAVQNMLLMATALGFGSALTSGKALKSHSLRTLFALQPDEHALCFVSLGTATRSKPARTRPTVAQYLSTFQTPSP